MNHVYYHMQDRWLQMEGSQVLGASAEAKVHQVSVDVQERITPSSKQMTSELALNSEDTV